MRLSRKAFQDWGAVGGRMRAARLSKARRRQIAKAAVAAREKKRVGRPKGSKNKKPPLPKRSNAPYFSPRSRVDLDRATAMYKAGDTLEVIGKSFGVTRERVRQVLKRAGISSMEGGLTIRAFLKTPDKQKKRLERQAKREEKAKRVWGISLEQYEFFVSTYGSQLVNTSPLCRFKTQRNSAKNRGIPWKMTFGEWWKIWDQSGRWEQRGRGYGYAMARIGDSGPYAVGNVEIITGAQNSSDSFIVKPAAKRSAMALETKRKNGTYPVKKLDPEDRRALARARYHAKKGFAAFQIKQRAHRKKYYAANREKILAEAKAAYVAKRKRELSKITVNGNGA